MRSLFKACLGAALVVIAAAASAQADFPNRVVKIVVPFAPGGVSDAIARPLANAMSASLGQPVIVENKPGAAGNIALEMVARAPADGYTLLLGNVSTNAMNQTSYAATLKVVPTKDFTAIGVVGTTPSVLVASMNFTPKNAQELIAHARANPGKINYWLPGVASGPHFDMVQLEKHAGIKMTAVPYSGGAGPGMTALIGGQVDIGLINLGGALPQVKAGKLKAIAVSTPLRLSDLPDVPTAAEAGLGSLSSSWQALFVPSATPKPVVQKLHAALNDALGNPEVKDAIAKAATVITPSKSPDEAQAWVVAETNKWAKIITDSGIKPEQ
ncbi:MAG: tripartite tricarboxylate transporter substrate binding protein [Burkholderiales bacterium]|nr:tripartite tricarboxylate transporter substrate binding protein [Burkholderiales bacterium]